MEFDDCMCGGNRCSTHSAFNGVLLAESPSRNKRSSVMRPVLRLEVQPQPTAPVDRHGFANKRTRSQRNVARLSSNEYGEPHCAIWLGSLAQMPSVLIFFGNSLGVVHVCGGGGGGARVGVHVGGWGYPVCYKFTKSVNV